MALKNTIVTDIETLVYQSQGSSAVTTMYFCNAGEITVKIDVYLVPAGSWPDFTNLIYTQLSLPCFDTFVMDTEKIIFENNDRIYAKVYVPDGELISNLPVIATVSAIEV